MKMPILSQYQGWGLAALRISTAFFFWQHGAQKLLGWLGREPVAFLELRWFAGILEFFGGILVGVGLFTGPVAFLLSGQMAVAYFMRHAPEGFWPVLNGGERAALFCFIFFFLSFSGPGRLALDNILFRKK